MVSDRIMAPGSVFTNKQISILKSAKSLGIIRKTEFGKTKGNEHKLVNGFQNSKIIVKSSTMSKAQESTSTGLLQKSISNGVSVSGASPQSIKVIQATKANDLASLSNLIAKKMTKNHMLEQVKTYICKYCCRKFPNSCLLEIHYKSHGPNPSHACHLCGINASNFSSLMCHYVKHSKGKTASTYRIKQEKDKVPVIEAFKKKIIHKPETAISCTRCKRSFSTKEIFNVHYCPALNKKSEYVCTYCRKVTTTVEEYRDHIQSHSVSPYVCTACNIQFPKKSQLSAHTTICPKKKQNVKRNLAQSPTKGKKKIKIVPASQPEKQEKLKKSPKKETLKTTEVKSDNSPMHVLDQKTPSHETEENSATLNSHHPLNQSLLNSTMQNNPSTSFQDQPEMASPKPAKKRRRRRRRTTVEMLNLESEPAHERPTRNLRSPSRYIADQNSAYAPTRRSARLVNRKRITFSDDEDEASDHEVLIEVPIEQDTQKESSKSAEETNVKMEPSKVNIEECLDVVIKQDPVAPVKMVKTKAMRKKRIRKSQNKTSTLYCQVCSLLFRSMGSLRRHRKMHTGKPQFVCQFCGKFFFRRDIHLRHENSVHQNSADRGFHCYYCKQKFVSSALLMEHSTATHVTKALVPERIRRCTRVITCTGVSKSPKDKKPVASFLLADVKKETLEVSKATLRSIYDCEAFSTPKPPRVEQNRQEHSDIKYPVHTPDSQECIDIKPTLSQLSKCLLQNEVLNSLEKTPRETTVSVDSMRLQRKDTKETVTNTCQEIVHSNSNKLNSSLTQFDSCKLCSKELTEGQDSICSPHVTHKIVDWYQCMVCPYSGTKSQVQEHMITHTYKIGTLVVSEEDLDYNSVRTFLPLFSDAMDVPEPENDERSILQNNNEERNILQQNCGDDDAQRDVRDCNSPYTLMEEVMCSRCGDVIIDLEVLTLHPCSETDNGTFTCFIGICHYNTPIKSNIQKHLAERHFVALFSDVLFGPTCKRKTPEKKCEENALPLKRYTQHIEDIFIGPSLDS